MKKLMLLLLLIPICCFGQDEKSSNKIAVEKFIEQYNSENYTAIFSMFAEVMKDALPMDKTSELFTTLNSQVGKIENKEFIRYENETYASYKTKFEQAILTLNISLDQNEKINGLFIKPYVEEVYSKNAINNLSEEENIISENQKNLIFDKAKFFPNRTQISIALVENGKVRYYGLKRHNDSISPIHNYQNIFEIGSISKVFTSNLLARTVIANKVNLDDHINEYLGLQMKDDVKISFQSLANHSSGLPRLPSNFTTEKLDTVNTVKVRHILIPYKGAYESNSEVVRSKKAAKKTADSISTLLKRKEAEFKTFVHLSAERKISNEYGEIEFTYFDSFVPKFRDFSFQNKIGTIDVIETMYGFHIIEILSRGENQKVVNVRNLEDNPYKYYDQFDLNNYLENLLDIDEDTKGSYLYSNLGVGILGYTLAKIYGLNYEQLFQKYIFSKFKMHSTTFNIELLNNELVPGLDGQGNEVSNWNFSVLAPAGGILSNVEDMAKYVLAQFDDSDQELRLMRKKTIKIDSQFDMGLGWHIINSTKSNDQLYTHGGGTGGYTSSILVDLKNEIGVVLLSNVSAFNPANKKIEVLSYDLIKNMREKYTQP